jgi:hypothetical protein
MGDIDDCKRRQYQSALIESFPHGFRILQYNIRTWYHERFWAAWGREI